MCATQRKMPVSSIYRHEKKFINGWLKFVLVISLPIVINIHRIAFKNKIEIEIQVGPFHMRFNSGFFNFFFPKESNI